MTNFSQHQQSNRVNQDYTGTYANAYIQPMRLENANGESQVHPPPNSYQAQAHLRPGPPLTGNNESGLEPVVAVLSMQLKWERLLAQERNISRGLNQFSNNLQMRLHECEAVSMAKDARIKNLEDENGRLCKSMNNSQFAHDGSNSLVTGAANNVGNGANTQDETRTPATLSDYRSITDFSPSSLMLPPLQTTGTGSTKRKSISPTSPLATRKRSNRASTHPASPRRAFNSSKTPSPLDPFRMTW